MAVRRLVLAASGVAALALCLGTVAAAPTPSEPVSKAIPAETAAEPAALPRAIRFDARTTYHDDATYLEVLAYGGAHVGVRPRRNYFHFTGTSDAIASPYLRPGVLIHFRARADTRYLMECAVAAGSPTTFTAVDARGEYSVRTDERSTLLYIRDQLASDEDVVVKVSGDTSGWYLDGCELTQSPR